VLLAPPSQFPQRSSSLSNFPSFSLRPPPTPSLFPYTTLFRSSAASELQYQKLDEHLRQAVALASQLGLGPEDLLARLGTLLHPRSEEHTSELQSRENLVCRLLLEKKKNR